MNIFLSEDNSIILPHLNHVLKSYYYTTGYSVYAYNREGNLIDKVTKNNFDDVTQFMNNIVKKNILDFIINTHFSDLDSLLFEIFENTFTIIAPVIKNRVDNICYLPY